MGKAIATMNQRYRIAPIDGVHQLQLYSLYSGKLEAAAGSFPGWAESQVEVY